MNNQQKAAFIRQKTNNGQNLNSAQVMLLYFLDKSQWGEECEQHLDDLYQAVRRGADLRNFHFIDHLTKDDYGNVYWKGKCIEHFSFQNRAEEKAAAKALAAACRRVEERGYPVNSRTVDVDSPFADAPAGSPWAEAMLSYYAVAADQGKAKWMILQSEMEGAIAMTIDSGRVSVIHAQEEIGAPAVCKLLWMLQRGGLSVCNERLHRYDSFVQCMAEAGFTPEAVHQALQSLPAVLVAEPEEEPF